MRRMLPFPFPVVPLAFGFVFLAVWAAGSTAPTGGWGTFSPLAVIIVVALVVAVGLVVGAAVTFRSRRAQKQHMVERVARTRTVIRQQLDAIANDILKLEGEVRASGDEAARTHFRDATITYADAVGQLETADAASELTALARRLDTAIWQLDTTEAILDGRPLPAKPRAGRVATRSATRTPDRRPAGRRSTTGVFDLIFTMLEASPGSVPTRVRTRRRSHSRHHC